MTVAGLLATCTWTLLVNNGFGASDSKANWMKPTVGLQMIQKVD